jgi:glycosyltransferase involved in cell wall biosynthesis
MNKNVALNLGINSTSMGQCAHSIAREFYRRDLNPCIFHVGAPDHSTQKEMEGFKEWIVNNSIKSDSEHNRDTPTFKLWHPQQSLESFSKEQLLYTFYELDSPTKQEINILKNQKVVFFSSDHFTEMFKSYGINAVTVPIGFDSIHFKEKEIKFSDDRINFGLGGKLEKRKHHLKILKSWAKKYGNQKGIFLNCAIFNPHIPIEQQQNIVGQALEGKRYYNINFIGWCDSNEKYNSFLNANNIMLALSGGEGYGVPEFTSVALGKHCVGLYAHGYKQWMTDKNSTIITPSGKLPAYDGLFFKEGSPYNQGNIFDFDDDDFLSACDVAIQKVKSNPVNVEGKKLQEITWDKSVDEILKHI